MAWRHPPQLKSAPRPFLFHLSQFIFPLPLTPNDPSPSRPVDRRLPSSAKGETRSRTLNHCPPVPNACANAKKKKKKPSTKLQEGSRLVWPQSHQGPGDQPHPLIGGLGTEPPPLTPPPIPHRHPLLARRYRCFLNVLSLVPQQPPILSGPPSHMPIRPPSHLLGILAPAAAVSDSQIPSNRDSSRTNTRKRIHFFFFESWVFPCFRHPPSSLKHLFFL